MVIEFVNNCHYLLIGVICLAQFVFVVKSWDFNKLENLINLKVIYIASWKLNSIYVIG